MANPAPTERDKIKAQELCPDITIGEHRINHSRTREAIATAFAAAREEGESVGWAKCLLAFSELCDQMSDCSPGYILAHFHEHCSLKPSTKETGNG